MYRILVADDEGIMLEAFKSVIPVHLGTAVSQKLPRQEEQ